MPILSFFFKHLICTAACGWAKALFRESIDLNTTLRVAHINPGVPILGHVIIGKNVQKELQEQAFSKTKQPHLQVHSVPQCDALWCLQINYVFAVQQSTQGIWGYFHVQKKKQQSKSILTSDTSTSTSWRKLEWNSIGRRDRMWWGIWFELWKVGGS